MTFRNLHYFPRFQLDFFRAVLLLTLAFCSLACGPAKYVLDIEMRKPSLSGIDLVGKNVSVVFVEAGDSLSDGFNSNMAKGFASSLESSYGWNEGSVGIYSVSGGKDSNYACRDSLLNLVVDTDADLVFLFDTLQVTGQQFGDTHFSMNLHCYDGMNPADKVQTFSGSSSGVLGDERYGIKAGEQVSLPFRNQWKVEQFSFLYFESARWYDALAYVERFSWKDAMDIWMELLSSSDSYKRSCAEYNIATACFITGDYSLAKEWLDRSDQENKLPVSDTLHKRLAAARK